jgi:uncharacterized protein
VVEDCVNSVGVDLNTASVPLLSRVSGLSGSVAKAVVRWREANGAFKQPQAAAGRGRPGRQDLRAERGLLRIRGGDNPLDMTGVHPETYPVVEQIMDHRQARGRADGPRRHAQDPQARAVCQRKFGVITVKDILGELEKPGRDPRPDFKVARFNDGVEDIKDLQGRHDAGGHGQQRGAVWRLRRPGRAPGRPGACEPAGAQVRERRARGGQDRRHRQGQRCWRWTWRASASA